MNTSSNVNDDFGKVDDDGNIDTVQATNEQSVIVTDSYGASLQLTLLNKLGGMDNQLSRHGGRLRQLAFHASLAGRGFHRFARDHRHRSVSSRRPMRRRATRTTASISRHVVVHEQWSMTLAGRYNWSKRRSAMKAACSRCSTATTRSRASTRRSASTGIRRHLHRLRHLQRRHALADRDRTRLRRSGRAVLVAERFHCRPDRCKPVISKTFEVGARGQIGNATTWSAAAYSTTLDNDIQFISSNGAASTLGFFQNVGKTRRQGVELAGHTQYGPLGVAASYSYVDATYQSTWTESSASNSSADANGNITVKPGDHIPGIPANTIKLRLDYAATPKWKIGHEPDLSRQHLRARRRRQPGCERHGRRLFPDRPRHDLQRDEAIAGLRNRDESAQQAVFEFRRLGENFFNGPNHTFDGANPVNEQFLGPGRRAAVGGVAVRVEITQPRTAASLNATRSTRRCADTSRCPTRAAIRRSA